MKNNLTKPYDLRPSSKFASHSKFYVKDCIIYHELKTLVGKQYSARFEWLYPDTDELSEEQIEQISVSIVEAAL